MSEKCKIDFMTVAQMAEERKVSTTAVYSWIKQGLVESMKVGKITLVKYKNEKR